MLAAFPIVFTMLMLWQTLVLFLPTIALFITQDCPTQGLIRGPS